MHTSHISLHQSGVNHADRNSLKTQTCRAAGCASEDVCFCRLHAKARAPPHDEYRLCSVFFSCSYILQRHFWGAYRDKLLQKKIRKTSTGSDSLAGLLIITIRTNQDKSPKVEIRVSNESFCFWQRVERWRCTLHRQTFVKTVHVSVLQTESYTVKTNSDLITQEFLNTSTMAQNRGRPLK